MIGKDSQGKHGRGRTTVRDIAQMLEISTATVSRALSDRPGVSDEVRQRVRIVAQKTGYQGAQHTTLRSPVVVAMISEGSLVNDPFYPSIQQAFERTMQRHRISTVMASFDGQDEQSISDIDHLCTDAWLAGFIIVGRIVRVDVIERIVATDKPTIMIDNTLLPTRCTAIVPDNVHGAYRLTAHLIAHGAKRLSYVGGPQHCYSTQERMYGFLGALSDAQLSPHAIVLGSGTAVNDGLTAGADLLDAPVPPDAVVAVNDAVALGVLQTARDRGCRVPESLRICGFDDIQWSRLSAPPLSTCRIDLEALGRVAAERMVTLLRHPAGRSGDDPQRIVLPVQPVFRESCGCDMEKVQEGRVGVGTEERHG